MDEDLQQMSKDQLIEEVKKLCAGNREHRDSTGRDLCCYHPRRVFVIAKPSFKDNILLVMQAEAI